MFDFRTFEDELEYRQGFCKEPEEGGFLHRVFPQLYKKAKQLAEAQYQGENRGA